MRIIRTPLFILLSLFVVSCDAQIIESTEPAISIFSKDATDLLKQLKRFSGQKDTSGIYSLFGDAMRDQLPQHVFDKSLNKAWSIKQAGLINVEDYGRYKALIVNVSEIDQSGIESRSIKIIYAVEEAGVWKLYNFPFTKSGAPGLVLRTPQCFQS